VGALWTLLPSRTPGLVPLARRSLMLPLTLLALALSAQAIPGVSLAALPAIGVLWAAVVGTVVVGAVPLRGVIARAVGWLAVPLALLLPASIVQVAGEDVVGFEVAHREPRRLGPVHVAVSARFETAVPQAAPRGLALPVQAGLIDEIELRGGALIQVVVTGPAPDREPSALLRLDPDLDRELREVPDAPLPEAFGAAWKARAPEVSVRVTALRRNGAAVGIVVERPIGRSTVALVAAPASALDHAAPLYAAILADAR
jgi:hypothetical protein